MAIVLGQTNGDAVGCPTIEISTEIAEARDVTIVAVTTDQELRGALGELLSKKSLVLADTAEQALATPVPNNCAVLIVEQTLSRSVFDQLKAHLKASAPALVSIMVGTGESGSSLVARLSAGHIDRFMVKPFKVGPTRSVLRSALQQYRSLCQCMRAEGAAMPIRVATSPVILPSKPVSIGPKNAKPVAQANRNETRSPAPVLKQLAIVRTQKGAKADRIKVANEAFIGSPNETSAGERTSRTSATRKFVLPTWGIPFAALTATFALVVIGFAMREPELSKDKVIAGHLAAANRAVELGSYADPPGLSAEYFYSSVLELDPANMEAKRGLETIADRLIAAGKERIGAGDLLTAQTMLDSVRRIQPNHRELADATASLLSAREFERAALDAARAAPAGNGEAAIVLSAQAASGGSRLAANKPIAPERRGSQSLTRSAPTKTANAVSPASAYEKSRIPELPQADQVKPMLADSSNAKQVLPEAPVDQRGARFESAPAESSLIAVPAVASIQEKNPVESAVVGTNTQSNPAQGNPAASAANVETKLLKYVAPVYPQKARTNRVEAWVDVHFDVASDGSVIKPRIENGTRDPAFRSAALAAVSQWRYSPAPTGASPNRPMIVKMKFQLADGKRT